MLSVRDFAQKRGLSYGRVLELVHSKSIEHVRVGRTIAIPESELSWTPLPSRPLSGRMTDALLNYFSGNRVEGLSSSECSRLKGYVFDIQKSAHPSRKLHEKTASRSLTQRYSLAPSAVLELSRDPRLRRTGISYPRSGVSGGGVFEAYVAPGDLEGLVDSHWLERSSEGNVYLYPGLVPEKYLAWAAADLARWNGPREINEADRLLSERTSEL